MILFFIEEHQYKDSENLEKKFVSCTGLIEHYVQKFNEDYWSTYKAYEKFLTSHLSPISQENKDIVKAEFKKVLKAQDIVIWKQYDRESFKAFKDINAKFKDVLDLDAIAQLKQEFIDGWNVINAESLIKGSEVHDNKEADSLSSKFELNPYDNRLYPVIENSFIDTQDSNMKVSNIDLDNLDMGFYPEIIVYYKGIIGQIDRLFVDEHRNFYIKDYKTNKEIKLENKFSKMRYPLQQYDDCNYNHYMVQLNIYAYILLQYNYTCKGLSLDHIPDSTQPDKMIHYDLPIIPEIIKQLFQDHELGQSLV